MQVPRILWVFFIIVIVNTGLDAQSTRPVLPPPENTAAVEQAEQIRARMNQVFRNLSTRPDYPIQDFYIPPNRRSGTPNETAQIDTTPPVLPSAVTVTTESIHGFVARWSPAIDPESGIDYYAYAIGTQPGEGDIRWWQSVGSDTVSYSSSMTDLGLVEGQPFYVAVYCVNAAGLASEQIVSGPASFQWQPFGLQEYELTVALAEFGYDSTGSNLIEGWTAEERVTLNHFITRMNPIIKEIYGPPSQPYTVTLIKNLWYSGSNIFFPSSNEIHMAELYPQLLTHELLHAYRDNVILSTDDDWQYNPRLSGFEESFAQAVSYLCMNRYIELYPADIIADSTHLYGSSTDWDYDFKNVAAITSEDFWSDTGGMGLFWRRYELGAAAIRKIQLQYPNFPREFNAAYYTRLNADHALTTSRDLMVDIIAAIAPEIEMLPAAEWLGRQRIFDCRIQPGKKIWLRTQHYPWSEFLIFQRVYYYETFTNGSDWAYWDEGLEEWIYHSLNGSSGTATVRTHDDSVLAQRNLLIEPVQNPPDLYAYGSDEFSFSTDSDLEPWPQGDTADYLLNMKDLHLYSLDISFDETTLRTHRVIGEDLKSTTGVFGGIRNATDGVIHLDHEGYPEEPPLPVNNGAFSGQRNWASVANPLTGGTDSRPGQVHVRFVQSDGRQFVAQRNVDWGSWNGNQAFLFDTEEMILDTTFISSVQEPQLPGQFALFQNYPNPFNPTTTIDYSISKPDKVVITVFNITGQRVKILFSGKQQAGQHVVTWDGRDARGRNAASGVYLYQLQTAGSSIVKKMLLVR